MRQRLPWQSSGQDSMTPVQRARIQSLVRELRSHISWDVDPKKKKKIKAEICVSEVVT